METSFIAERRVRRHMLAERFLVDVLGLEWAGVHREADRLAPVISSRVEDRLRVLLGDPATCPHGNPIPGVAHAPDQSDAIRLIDAHGPVVITRVADEIEHDIGAMRQLQSCGLIPGQPAEVRGGSGEGVVVLGPRQEATIPTHVARHTYVTPQYPRRG